MSYGIIIRMSEQQWPEDVFGPPIVKIKGLPRLHPSLTGLSVERVDVSIDDSTTTPEETPSDAPNPAPNSRRTHRRPVPDVERSNMRTYDEKPNGIYRGRDGRLISF